MNGLVVLESFQISQVVPPVLEELLADDLEPGSHSVVELGHCAENWSGDDKYSNYNICGLLLISNSNISGNSFMHYGMFDEFQIRVMLLSLLLCIFSMITSILITYVLVYSRQ